ncbi:MAG: GEVED domain-containing protein [Flavobacteriales bacterium]
MTTSTLRPIINHFITGAAAIAFALLSHGDLHAQDNEEGNMAYCAAGAGDVLEAIWIVDFADIYHLSATYAGYENFLSWTAHVQQGSTYPIRVELDLPYPQDQVRVWIDLDQDQTFETNEVMYTSAIGEGPHMGTVNIPMNATPGTTRMRVRLWDTLYGPNSTPCGDSDYGQVEDYSIEIQGAVGVAETPAATMSVFPNPGNGRFSIAASGLKGSARIDVMDMSGRTVFSEAHAAMQDQRIDLDLSNTLGDGVYLLRLADADQQIEQRIVIRQ